VKDLGASELRQMLPAPAAPCRGARVRAAAAGFWLQCMFFLAQRAPWFARMARGPFVRVAIRCSRFIRASTAANARRIIGLHADHRRFARGVVANFYDFVCDVGQSLKLSPEQLAGRVDRIEGHERYIAARAKGGGAIILTAHMGSFEVGVAALLKYEPKIHVVFKRDTGRFERIRQALRQRLGVIEQPVDDGLDVWMRLRDALRNNEVVAIQGDRVMPGQKGRRVAFLGGHVLLPAGPVKLSMASGAPIIPVFSVRTPEGNIRLFIEEPIRADDGLDAAMGRVAAVIERYVAAYPEQWLVLHPAFDEDAAAAQGRAAATAVAGTAQEPA
jgi:phosphatidylinositol dimannoside acyltransferase